MKMKILQVIFSLSLIILAVGLGIYSCNPLGLHWVMAAPMAIGIWIGFLICLGIIGGLIGLLVPFIPIRTLQRPLYNMWKEKLLKADVGPAATFPFRVYVQFELDKEFEAGGFRQAQKAVNKWLKEYPERFVETVINAIRVNLPKEEDEAVESNEPIAQ